MDVDQIKEFMADSLEELQEVTKKKQMLQDRIKFLNKQLKLAEAEE